MPREHRLRLLLAFAAVYVLWGSTYLAIRFAIDTIPPFLMAGLRHGIAGVAIVWWARRRRAAWPSAAEWRTAAIVGPLLLLGGNGGVSWAEQRVPSGLAALLVAAVPLWAVTIDWLRPGGARPGRATILGLVTGFLGVAILVNPRAGDAARVDPVGAMVLIVAAVSWAGGSIVARHAKSAPSPLMATGANMLTGSAALLVTGLLAGDFARFHPAAVSARSSLALAYLIVFGSVAGFTAYIWLLRHTAPAKATTYAYVNPVVAILLGWALGNEPITLRIALAAAVIISGVVMIAWLPGARAALAARRANHTPADSLSG